MNKKLGALITVGLLLCAGMVYSATEQRMGGVGDLYWGSGTVTSTGGHVITRINASAIPFAQDNAIKVSALYPFARGIADNGVTGYVLSSNGDNTFSWIANGSGSMVYPGAGVPLSTGSAWGSSYTVGTGANNLVQLNASSQLPAVSAALLTNFPTLNQNTTGTAAGLTAQYINWSSSSGGASVANRPTINGVTVTGAVLDNASNYPTLNQNTTGSAASYSGASGSLSGAKLTDNTVALTKLLTTGCTDNQVAKYTTSGGWACGADATGEIGSGIANVVEDTTPQLGGDLDLNGHVITGFTINGVAVQGTVLDNALNYPTLNQSTTGAAAALSGQYIDWNAPALTGPYVANKPTIQGQEIVGNVLDNALNYPPITAIALSAQYIDWAQDSGGVSVANRPTINSVVVTGAVLDNASNYPAALARLVSPVFTTPNIGSATGSITGNAGGTAAGLTAQYVDWNSGSGGSSIANKPTLGTLSTMDNGTMTTTKTCIFTSGTGIVCNTTPSTVATALSEQYIDWSQSSGATSIANKPSVGTLAALASGTMTNAKICTYASSGTTINCNTDAAGGGDFSGPASSTDNAVVKFNGAGGKTGQNSGCTIGADNVMTCAGFSTGAGTDGSRKITLTNNTAASPTASTNEIYFEGNVLKVNEDGTERTVAKTDGNVATATALAADPANCSAGQIALGVTAAGVAECTATPSGLTSVGATTFTGALTGNASTATALAADPADCSAGQLATGIAASGALSCTASPAVTTAITSATAGGATTGTAALPFSSVYLGNAATNNIQLTGTAASAKVVTLPGQTGTVTVAPTTTTANQHLSGTATAGLGAWSTSTYADTFAAGDILKTSSANTVSGLAAVAAGQPLLSGGASTAPAYAGYTFSGTAGQTYTFPATSKTLMATDGNTSGTAANVSGTPALPNGTTATRQSADDATDKLATDNWVITQAYAKINRTKTFSFAIDNVISTDNVLMWRVPVAVTITQANCYATVDNVVGSLMECATDNVTSCTVLDSWTVTNAVNDFTDASMTDGAVAAGAWVRWSTTSVGTASMNRLSCTIQYNE